MCPFPHLQGNLTSLPFLSDNTVDQVQLRISQFMNSPQIISPQEALSRGSGSPKNFGISLPLAQMNIYHHRPHRLILDAKPETNKNGSGETNFDTTMVIILAALLSALICALGLNSIVRCALRCSRRRFTFETPDETAARLASTGLKKSMLRRIPVAVYGAGGIFIPATDCSICLGEFMDGEKVRVLPKCHHGFHVRCIDIWFASHSSCPICRQSLLERSPPPCSGAADGGEVEVRVNSNAPGGDGGGGDHAHVPGSGEDVG